MSFGGFGTPTTSSDAAAANSSTAPASSTLFGSASSSSAPKISFTSTGGASNTFGQPSGGDGSAKPSNIFGAGSSGSSGSLFGMAQSSSAFGAGNSATNKTDSGSSSSMPGGSSAGTTIFGSQKQTDAATGQQSAPAAGLFASTGNSLFGNKNADAPAPAAFGLSTPVKPALSLMSTTPADAPPTNLVKSAAINAAAKQTSGTLQLPSSSTLFGGAQAPAAVASGGSVLGAVKPPSSTPLSPFPSQTLSSSNQAANPSGAPSVSSTPTPFAPLMARPPAEESSTGPKPTPGKSIFSNLSTPATVAQQSSSSPLAMPSTSSASQPDNPAPASTGVESRTPAAATSTPGNLFTSKPTTDKGTSEQDKDKNATQAQAQAQAQAQTQTQNGPANPLGASTSGPTSQLPRLKNKTMEDIVTRWASDLTKYQKEFKEQATVVSEWDRNLVDNGEKIQRLYLDTFEAERASNEIERQLVAVESQQDELEAWLDRYESEVQDMFSKQSGPGEQLSGPDQERERTYKLAEKMTQQLDEKSRDLSKMVKEINDISGTLSKGVKAEDPLSQIVRVLNGHLTQLQWIDTNTAALTAKVAAAHKAASAFNHNHAGIDNDAAESFYRSYMGRR
ncbi:hypothetical protein CDD82_6088 [Ophiocordyceps australis]|uniref:Nucleoporin NSP1 n=1 Tax=Ophiocordyceps australis TaxID=1399860 RepID=A0A2C5ZUT8_9HYPO|nr:hypothetical protein CDD82_6088 [Ophiocordyceps australis]